MPPIGKNYRETRDIDEQGPIGRSYDGLPNQASAAGASPAEVPMLDEFTNRIRAATARAALILDRVTNLGDRAFGLPTETCTTSGETVGILQEGAVDRVFCALSDLDAVLVRLEYAENRIDGLA